MFYSVELPFLKRVYYGISDDQIDIYEFAKRVRKNEIYISEAYKHLFDDDRRFSMEVRVPIAVLREVKNCNEKQFTRLLKIGKNKRYGFNEDDPNELVICEQDGKKVRKDELELYQEYCINKTLNYEEEVDRFYYRSHK